MNPLWHVRGPERKFENTCFSLPTITGLFCFHNGVIVITARLAKYD